MNEQQKNLWYRVPEVWLILILLGSMVIGSFALLYEALAHPDVAVEAPAPIAAPLPPPATRPADSATP